MKHILVPIGSTENAQNTLQYAIDFAAEVNAKILVFRAYNVQTKAGTIININAIIERETNLYLKTLVSNADRKNVDIKLISSKRSVIDSVEAIDNEIGIDLIIVSTKSNSIKDAVFLGKTPGKLVKQTDLPIITVPRGYKFSPPKNILMAFKSGVVKRKSALNALKFVVEKFKSEVNLLLVKTPDHTEEDSILNSELTKFKTNLTVSENSTTFQGVIEHFQTHKPDMLCVFRRKRGFFSKLWEKNTILKEEFHATIPLLILKGKK